MAAMRHAAHATPPGGARRRHQVGEYAMLFADEISTGLDAASTFDICE